MNYLFVDLDGTALNDSAVFSLKTLSALQLWKNTYNLYIASGRPSYLLDYYIKQLQIDNPVISGNGTLIYDPVNAQTLLMRTVPEKISRNFIEYCWNRHMDFVIFTADAIYITDYSVRISRYHHYNSLVKNTGSDKTAPIIICHSPEEFYKLSFSDVLRLSMLVDSTEHYRQMQAFTEHLSGVAASKSSSDVIDIYSDRADKWDAIQWLCHYKGIPLEEICVIGNDENDLQMIRNAPLSFCVQNAIVQARQAADDILPSNTQNGVAYAVRNLLMSKSFFR